MNKLITAILILIFTLISANPFVDTFSGTAYAGENEPEVYVVEKADSLWGISDNKLEDPFLWPRLWSVNPQIQNPDLIYPGTKIIIPTREELLALPTPPPMPRNMSLSILKRRALTPLSKLVFEFPEEGLNKYIIGKKRFITSGWIASAFPGTGKLLFTEKGSKLVDKGDIVYLETSGRSEPGSIYYTIKSVKKVKHPVTREKVGQQIAISGILEIIGADDNVLKARITTAFDDITVGDGILPFKEMNPPLFRDDPRTPDISGYIIESRINSSISSLGDIIFLDRGSNDGVETGDIFKMISEQPVRRTVGELQIIRTQPDTSTALITKSVQEIFLGSQWGQK